MKQKWGRLEGPFSHGRLLQIAAGADDLLRLPTEALMAALMAQIVVIQDSDPIDDMVQFAVAAQSGVPARKPAEVTPAMVDPICLLAQARRQLEAMKEDAFDCAVWMDAQKLPESPHCGPFGPIDIRPGDTVLIRKGVRIFSYDPVIPSDGALSKRAQKVVVSAVFHGYINRTAGSTPQVEAPEVRWAGSRRFWRWTATENVEKITADG